MDKEARLAPVFNLQVVKPGFGRNIVGLSNRGVRFQNAQSVFELHVERVLPDQVADVLDLRKFRGPKRDFGICGDFSDSAHKLNADSRTGGSTRCCREREA